MENGVIMQYFQWYTPADGSLWNELAGRATELAENGFTAVWIPPCGKGSGGPIDVGYGAYDLFDLGEFDQKGSIRTKYGTKEELLRAIQALKEMRVQCYADVVFNHKDGADEIEQVWIQEVDWNDRNDILSGWYQIPAWTKFNFPGRGHQYSSMVWNWECFDALSYNAATKRSDKLYRLKDKYFQTDVSHEHGTYDYLMANELDTSFPSVYGELMYWGRWFLGSTDVDGFRIDACKHIRSGFFREWLQHLRGNFADKELFSVGEYWSGDPGELLDYLDKVAGAMSLFDVPLHYRFYEASRSSNYDMRTILDATLVRERPWQAVTFVENHDTQPYQSLESTVEAWFKPIAYALILLRREGYPCVFYGDYYPVQPTGLPLANPRMLYSHRWLIDKYLFARKAYGFGDQRDYFDHANTIGWTRLGTADHPGSMAVVLTNGADGDKWMNMYRPNAVFYDLTEHIEEKIITNADGWGHFRCRAGKVSVWLQE
jgi:alpha-amylase